MQNISFVSIPTTLTVQVGSNHLLGGKEYKIANVYLHENRGDLNTFFGNDIAAIKLSKRIEFNENVQPIELGTEELPKGAVLTVTGWGKTRVSMNLSNIKQNIFSITIHLNRKRITILLMCYNLLT